MLAGGVGEEGASRKGGWLTSRAVVVAGQDGPGVVAEAVPIVVVAAVDSLTSRGKAVCDDAVGLVSPVTRN